MLSSEQLIRRGGLCALAVALLVGCGPPPPAAAPAAPAAPPALTVKQLMEWVIDPTADVIWDSVKSISTRQGTQEIAPQSDEQWGAVRNAAATLSEAGHLLMLPGRARNETEWAVAAQALARTAEIALKAAETKDKDALFAVGGDIYTVCRGCHLQYAPQLVSWAKLPHVVPSDMTVSPR